MPLGLLASGAVGEVTSPAKVLTLLPSGMWQEAAWGAANALGLVTDGHVKQGAVQLIATTSATGPINSSSYTVNKPTGAQAGDYVLLAVSVNNNTGTTGPAGFTQVSLQTTQNVDAQQLALYGRVLDGSEGASFTATIPSTAYNNWAVMALLFRGADATTPVASLTTTIADSAHTGTFNVTAPSLDVAQAGSMLVFVPAIDINAANAGNTVYSTPPNFTSQGTLTSARQVTSLLVATRAGVASGASGTVTSAVTTPATCAYMGVLLAITPALPLSLTGTPPSGKVGITYSYTFTASGGVSPYTYAVTSGAVPAGLTLSSAGVLSGTPTTEETSSFTVTATDHIGSTAPLATSVMIAAAPSTALTVGVSTVAGNLSGAATTTTPAVATQASGSGFLVLVDGYGASAPTVSDNKGNTYTKIAGPITNPKGEGNLTSMYACANGVGGSGHTWSVTASGAYATLVVIEVKGASGFTVSASKTSSATSASGGPFTTAALSVSAAGMLIAGIGSTEDVTFTHSAGTGFTVASEIGTSGYWTGALAYLDPDTAKTAAASWTYTPGQASDGAAILLALEPA